LAAKEENSMLSALIAIWGVATVALIGILIVRSMLANHEDDQLFLGEGQEHAAKEQSDLQARIIKLGRYVLILGVTSAVLLVGIASLWVYQEFSKGPVA